MHVVYLWSHSHSALYCHILYFAWEDQSDAIVHTVLISCITVLYESYRTVLQLIGQIRTVQLCGEFI